MHDPAAVVGLIASAMVIVFLLGFNAAQNRNGRISRGLRGQLRLAERQRHQLTKWVRENWPNEYAAYQRGVQEGYQQGVLQGPSLAEDEP